MDSQEFRLLKEIIRGIPELVLVVSEQGVYLEVGGISEHDPGAIVGRSLSELFPEETYQMFQAALAEAFADPSGDVKTIEYELVPSPELKIPLENNEPRIFELKINPLSLYFGDERIAVCMCRDITDIRRHQQELVTLSERDPLTSVYNRNKLMEQLSHAFEAFTAEKTPASFLMFDLDNFKEINDRYGHQAGDKIIRHFAGICNQVCRESDTFGRLGGDEFGMVLPGTCCSAARYYAELIRKRAIQSRVSFQGERLPLSVSIGISGFDKEDKGTEAVITRADQAMYLSKHKGKNSVSSHCRSQLFTEKQA